MELQRRVRDGFSPSSLLKPLEVTRIDPELYHVMTICQVSATQREANVRPGLLWTNNQIDVIFLHQSDNSLVRRYSMADKEKKVLDAMKKAGKPVRPGDVAKMIGEDSKEVSKIISSLKKKGKVTSPKRCYYAPSGD